MLATTEPAIIAHLAAAMLETFSAKNP